MFITCRYGFNSDGHDIVRERLKNWRKDGGSIKDKHLGVSLGKNKTSDNATEDYVQGVRKLGEFADYLVINVSSPNTPGLRDLQGRQLLSNLLDKVRSVKEIDSPSFMLLQTLTLTRLWKREISYQTNHHF